MKCLVCSLSRLCLPASLSADEVDKLERIVRRNRPLKRGEYLFKTNEPMEHVFALRSGAIKNFLLDTEGTERVSGFILPGEMLGLDAIGASHYRSYAMALEISSLHGWLPRARRTELLDARARQRLQQADAGTTLAAHGCLAL